MRELDLSPRQLEVCVLAGCIRSPQTAKAIARELGCSKRTVEAHIVAGAAKIRLAYPHLSGSPRRICQAWIFQSYAAIAQNATTRRGIAA